MGTDLWAWVLIGAACSLAGMIYPFRRGFAGVASNAVAGMAGAVALGICSWMALHGSAHHRGDWTLAFAAAGALAAILLLHASYMWRLRAKRR